MHAKFYFFLNYTLLKIVILALNCRGNAKYGRQSHQYRLNSVKSTSGLTEKQEEKEIAVSDCSNCCNHTVILWDCLKSLVVKSDHVFRNIDKF